MKKNIHLSINEPCGADWNKMTPNKDGKHCSLCDKTVVDFTKMSPEEIQMYFLDNAGKKVCGNLYTHQLDHRKNKIQSVLSDFYTAAYSGIRLKAVRISVLFFVGIGLFIAGCRSRLRGAIDGRPCDDPRSLKGYTPPDSVKHEPVDTLKKGNK